MQNQIPVLMLAVVILGTLNNFAGRIKADTLGKYSGVVSGLVDAFIYMLFYLFLAAFQGAEVRGQVPKVLRWGNSWRDAGIWKLLVLAGLSDQIGAVFGFVAQPYLTTLMYSLMNQAIVPFTVVLSVIILSSRYIALELAAVCIFAGAAICIVLSARDSGGHNNMDMAVLTAVTTSFPAGAYVLKELAFQHWSELYQREIEAGSERPVNAVLVGAVCGVTSFFLSLPVVIMIQSLESSSPATDLLEGFKVLLGKDYALMSYSIYLVINLSFNFALLLLVGYGSALLAFLSLKLTVPFVALLSPLPWPIIGPSPVSPGEWVILLIMVGGVVAFRFGNQKNLELCSACAGEDDIQICCWPLLARRLESLAEEPLLPTQPAKPGRLPSLTLKGPPVLIRQQSAPSSSKVREEQLPEISLRTRSVSFTGGVHVRWPLVAPLLERGMSISVTSS